MNTTSLVKAASIEAAFLCTGCTVFRKEPGKAVRLCTGCTVCHKEPGKAAAMSRKRGIPSFPCSAWECVVPCNREDFRGEAQSVCKVLFFWLEVLSLNAMRSVPTRSMGTRSSYLVALNLIQLLNNNLRLQALRIIHINKRILKNAISADNKSCRHWQLKSIITIMTRYIQLPLCVNWA